MNVSTCHFLGFWGEARKLRAELWAEIQELREQLAKGGALAGLAKGAGSKAFEPNMGVS